MNVTQNNTVGIQVLQASKPTPSLFKSNESAVQTELVSFTETLIIDANIWRVLFRKLFEIVGTLNVIFREEASLFIIRCGMYVQRQSIYL